MERFFRSLVVVIVVLCAVTAYGGQNSPSKQYRAARNAYANLAKDVAKQQYRHNWDRVITPLQRFVKQYPRHDKTASAYYLLGKANRQLYSVSRVKADAYTAIKYFNTLSETYRDSSLADDALLAQAEIYAQNLHDYSTAFKLCKTLLERYPSGDMVGKIRILLKTLPKAVGTIPVKKSIHKKTAVTNTEITKVRYSTDKNRSRVVIELRDMATYRVNTLAGSQKNNTSPRLYIDLFGAKKSSNVFDSKIINSGVIKKIRLGVTKSYTRIVFDLQKPTDYNVVKLVNPPRIVVDIDNVAGAKSKTAPPKTKRVVKKKTKKQQNVSAILQQEHPDQPMRVHLAAKGKRTSGKLRIVVDAGHGGKDPGAVGSGKLYEKDVVLRLAKILAKRLKQQIKCEVLLTRDRDVFIPLRKRTAYANSVGADLFISIHANASRNKKAYGIETFYLNFSKNDKAVAVAARENGMSLQEVGDLELILFDLMANSKINESSHLAADIQHALTTKLKRNYSNIKNLGVRQGPFHVLLGATMPSVLVEVAFISNAKEAKRLKSGTYLNRSADGIVVGVKKYLQSQKLL